MAGKGIPHRYFIKRSNTLHERNIDEVALYFKELQAYAAAQPYLNPFLSVKALSPDAKASNASAKPSSKRTSADDDEQQLKVHFNPKATRKPGQVLKLHVTYDEMVSKEGAKFGWVDPVKKLSKEEIKANKEAFKNAIANRPTAVLREYERGPDGKPTPRLVSEIRYKGLGKTIGQMQPEKRVGNAAAAALGVVFDADGKMRCPPGTPNANQFTDENMSNCFVFSPLTVARGIMRSARRLAERLEGSGGATSRQDLRFDTEYDAEAFRRTEQVKRVYTTAERMREKWGQRTESIDRMLSKHGINSNDSIDAANADLIHALFNEYSFSKVMEIYSDADPDFTFIDPLTAEIITDDIWNSFDSAKKAEVASFNAKRYDESMRKEIADMAPKSIRDAARNGDANAQKSLNEFVERIRESHHNTQRGMLGSLLQYKDEMGDRSDAFAGFAKHGDIDDLVGTEATTWAGMDNNGMPAVTISINPISVAVQSKFPRGKDGALFLDIEADTSLSEAEKQTEILRVMREMTQAQEFVDLVGYANQQSAARGVADLGVSPDEMQGAHIMWHELGHVQQYNVARNKIYEFYDKNGFFPVVINGQIEKIETPPAAWSNGMWVNAMDSMMGAGGAGLYAKTGAMKFPPFGVDAFEESLLHFVSGERYQSEVRKARNALGLPEEEAYRQLALMEGTTELFALEKLGVIEGPEVRQFTSWMDPVDPAPIPSLPPGAPPEAPDVPGTNVPQIPVAPPVSPSPSPSTTVINNNTNINVVINGPINIHVGGTAPDWDKGTIEPPTPPRKTVDLKWDDITPMILGDRDSQWTATPSSGADIGQNKDLQKLWLDSVFGMGPEEGGFVPEQGELPRIDKDAYWKLSPQQMDTRYEFLRGEADLLIRKSETESLSKDEQAKLWLATKGMQQILDVNAKKAALSDEKRGEYIRDGFDPTPGKYIRQVDSPLKPQQKGFRKLAKTRAEERGYDVVEIDDDELSHWSREIADHAGTANDLGSDGFSAADRPYKRGEVRNNPSFSTKKNLERNPNYEPTSEPTTPDTDSAGYVGSKLDEIKSRSTPEQRALLDSSDTIEKRESTDALMDSSDPSKLSGMLSKSAEKRQAAKTGEELKRSTPGESGDILDDDFNDGVVPFLDLMESSRFDDDVKLVTSMDIPKNGISDGDTIDHAKIVRGQVVDFDAKDGFDFNQPEANRRVIIEMPKGSRGMPSKNSHNGETDNYLIPPGSLSVVRVDSDGTIFATPLEQHGKKEILDTMESNLNGVTLDADSFEELERRTLLGSIQKERSKIVPEKRTTRGMSSPGPKAARQSARNQTIADSFEKYGSDPWGSKQFGRNEALYEKMQGEALLYDYLKENPDSPINRGFEIPLRDQRVESSVAKLGGLVSGKAEPSSQEEFEFVNSLSPELRDLFTTLDASEIKSIVDDELFDYHQQFDDRVRISLHPEEFKEFLKTGKLKNITEAKPNSASASMLKEFESKFGMSEDLPDGARSHSGFMVHKTHTDEIADYLNELPGNGVTRNPLFFSETDEVNPSGKSRAGGKVIDLVLAPEVAQRAVYGRGDITSGDVLPTPVLSTNRAEVGSAFVHLSNTSQSSELDGMKQIAEVLESSITGNKAGLGGGHGVPTSVKSRNPGFAHEALVAGGITIADAEQVRVPVEALDMEDVVVSFDGVELENVRQQLSQAGLTNSEIDDVLDKISAGIAPYALPEIEQMRQGMASEKMSQELSLVPNQSMTIIPTNPDGIDVLNPDPLPGEPTTNKEMRDAWRKRYAVESRLESIEKLAKHEKETKGRIEPRMSGASARGESRVSQRRKGIRYSEDGYKSIYEKGVDDFVSDTVETAEYNPKTRELRVLFTGQSDPYHFLDVDPDDLEDFGDEFEPIGSKIDRIKSTNNRAVRGPDGSVIRWNGKEWSFEDEGMASKKPKVPFDGDIADKTPDDISFDSDIDNIIKTEDMNSQFSPSNLRDIEEWLEENTGAGWEEVPQRRIGAGMASRRDSKLAVETKPNKFGLGKKSKIKQGVESDEERRKRILELSKGDPRTSPGVRKANYQTYDGQDVYAVDNMDDAIALLVAGHHVDLSDSHDEQDLWTEFKSFKKWLKGVDKAAAKKMSFNLCSVHKEGANIFCGKHKGIIRDDMPQVGGTVTDPNAPAIRLWVGGHIHGNSFDSYNGADAPDWVKQGLLSEQTDPDLFKKAKAEYDRLENVYRALGSRYYPGNTVDPLTESEKQEFFSLTDIRKVEPDMIDNFVDVLKANGIRVSEPEERDPMTLRATQNELVAGTVLGLSDAITSYEDMLKLGQRPDGTPFTQQDYDRVRMLGPVLITKDGYILDGHHRVFGKVAANFDREDNDQLMQRVRVVDMPLEALLAFTRAYQEHIGIAAASGKSTERRTLPDEIKTPLDIIPAAADDLEKLNADFTDNLEDKVKALEERDGHPFFKPESPGFEQGDSYKRSMQFVERRVLTEKKPGERSSPSRVPSSGGMASRRSSIRTPGEREKVGAEKIGMASAVEPNAKKAHEAAIDKAFNELAGVSLDGLSDAEIGSRYGVSRRGELSPTDGKPIYHTNDTATAIALLSHGYNVEVDNDGTSSEIIDSQAAFEKLVKQQVAEIGKLENLSDDEKRALVGRFTVDLCKLYVSGKNLFCGENIGIDRADMPQLSGRAIGDDTMAMRAAKSGHVPIKWEAAKDLSDDEKKLFDALSKKHAAPGVEETLTPEEKSWFYSKVNWNDSEINVIDEFEKSLAQTIKPVDKDGNPVPAIKIVTGPPEAYKASQRQLDAAKVDGMRKGIVGTLNKFDEHATGLGLTKGSPEYKELRAKWLAGDYSFVDKDGAKVKAWWTDPLLATRDGYVLDGHHRWAALRLVNGELGEDEKLGVTWKEVQTNIVDGLTLGKAMQDKWGIKPAVLGKETQFVKDDAIPGITAEQIGKELNDYHANLESTLSELHSKNQFIRRGSVGVRSNPEVEASTTEAYKRGRQWAARQSGVSGGRVRVSREQLEEVRASGGGMRSSSARNIRVRAGEGGVPEKVSAGQPDVPEMKSPPKIERTHKGVDIPEFIDEMPAEGAYDKEVVDKAVELHEKVKKVEPELTNNLIDMAIEGGGQMEGLEFRFKATKGNAKKITNISRDSGISVEEAQSQVPDAVRYTMTFGDEDYVAGVENAVSRLEEMGHEVQIKNYWDEGDGYQGINVVVKHPDGFLYELQFHTPESFKVKQAAHDAYDEYQKEKDDVIRLELFQRMAAAAAKLPMPKGNVKGIGNLARKNFQTWAQQQGGK